MVSPDKAILEHLAARIRELERSAPAQPHKLCLGLPGLEEALPDSRLPAGALVELLATAEGAGTWTLALLMARQVCEQKLLVVIDVEERFYPPAAARLGIDLSRTLVIRAPARDKVLAVLVQSLRSPAVGAAIAPLERLSALHFRRLQLAAEAGGGLGILLRPAAVLKQPSFAAVRLLVSPVASRQTRRRVQIETVRLRDGRAGRCFFLELDDEKGHVRLLPSLAPATPVAAAPRPET